MKAVYAGLDVGTSGCKAALIDAGGRFCGSAHREYGFCHPGPGMVELDPLTVWSAVCETLKELASFGCEIRLLAVSSIGEALVMTDEKDRVLRNGIVYLDSRGAETVSYIRERAGEAYLHGLTGVPVNPMYTLNRHIWLRAHEPEVVERTARYFMFGDFIAYMLTGERVIDPSSASRTMLFDAGKLVWSQEIGNLFDVPVDRFSPVAPAGTVIGRLRRRIAEETGLPEDMKVVLGCHDQCSALLGAGAVSPGDVMAGEGSTESINLIVHRDCFNDAFVENHLCFEPYIRPEQYVVPVGQLAHGLSIRWFVEEFWKELEMEAESGGKSIYDLAEERCSASAGDVCFLPFLSRVKSMDASNRALGAFLGLDVNTDRAQMYRALLEGLCLESRVSFEVLTKLALPIRRITASGGGT